MCDNTEPLATDELIFSSALILRHYNAVKGETVE